MHHLPTHPLTTHPYTPPSSHSHSYLPPYSASSLPSLSSLPPLPPSALPTPAKAKLNSYLVELVKNSIRITDDFSAMCKAKVREKDQHIAQLMEEIERLRATSKGTQAPSPRAAQGHGGERLEEPSLGTLQRSKSVEDRQVGGESSADTAQRDGGRVEVMKTDAQLQATLAARDERIRLLQGQLTALRLSVQGAQHGAEVRERQLTSAKGRAESSAQLHRNAHVVTWLLLLILQLLLVAVVLHFRDAVIPAVCDFAFPYLDARTQTNLQASRVVREQCELEKDRLQLEWQQQSAAHQHDAHHHHHQHDDHGHTHVEEVQYKVVQCPPPVVCPTCPPLSCPPSLPLSEYEYGSAFSVNPADADASFLLSLSKGELVMQLLKERLKVEGSSQWEMTHRISKAQWDTERKQLQTTIQDLQLKVEQQPGVQPSQASTTSGDAATCSAALSTCEAQLSAEKKASAASIESLTLLTAEHERAKEQLTAFDAEKAAAESELQSAVTAAVAAEQAKAKEAQLRCDETAGWLETSRADSERLQVELHNAHLALDDATAQLAAAKAAAAATALQPPPSATAEVKEGQPQLAVPVVPGAATTGDASSGARGKEGMDASSTSASALQRQLEERKEECEEAKLHADLAASTIAEMRAQLIDLQGNHSILQAAHAALSLPRPGSEVTEPQATAVNATQLSATAEDVRQREELLALTQAEVEQLKQRTAELEASQRRNEDALQQSAASYNAQLTEAEVELSSARQAMDERHGELTSTTSRLSALTREHALSLLVIDELKAVLGEMQSHYEQQVASLQSQLQADAGREREAERTRQAIAQLHEQVKDAEQRAEDTQLLLSSMASDLTRDEQVSVQVDASGTVVGADVTAQLDLIEARINVSRLVNEKRELTKDLAALQVQVTELLSSSVASPSSASSAIPSTSAASDTVGPGTDAQLQRLRVEVESAERHLRECEMQVSRLQAEGERGGQSGVGAARSTLSTSSSAAYLPFLPGVPLTSFLSSFPSWSPVVKLLFLFSLITADLVLFQLSMPSRHRAFTGGMALLYTGLSALCVHYSQFVLALFLAANAVMALWMTINPSAALIACQWTCCGRPLGKKATASPSTALVLANGKAAHPSQPLLPPAPLPALAPPAGPLPPPMNGGGGEIMAPPMKMVAGQPRPPLPPPPRSAFSPSQSPLQSPSLPSRPLPSSFQVPPLPRPTSHPSPFPPSPTRTVVAPHARHASVPSVLFDDEVSTAGTAAGQGPPAAARPSFHRLPTSARMDVMEERQQSHPEWSVAPSDNISRTQTISSRLDISSSPSGDAGASGGNFSDGQVGGMVTMESGRAPDSTALTATPPPHDATPTSGRGMRTSPLHEAAAPLALGAAEGEGRPGEAPLASPSSRLSSASSSSDRSFPSFSPPLSSQAQPLSHSPLALQSQATASFSGYSSLPPTAPSSYAPSSFQQNESESASAYPSELSPAYPSSMSSSAASSALPSRRGSLSATGGVGSLPSMPPMPPIPSMVGAGGGGSGPMPPRPGMGKAAASGSYARRPPPREEDFA